MHLSDASFRRVSTPTQHYTHLTDCNRWALIPDPIEATVLSHMVPVQDGDICTKMPTRNILITGASGYLGGTVVAQLGGANLPSHGKIFALVRNDSQAKAVETYGLEAISFDPYDKVAVEENIIRHQISIVYWLVDSSSSAAQQHFIGALSKLKQETGQSVHFLHVKHSHKHVQYENTSVSSTDP